MPRCDEHTSERNSHGHNTTNHTNPAADRRFAVLALQLGLGLLAEWRTRADCLDLNNSRLNGTPVIGVAFGLTALQQSAGPGSEASSALEQVNDQDNNGNHEQEMN